MPTSSRRRRPLLAALSLALAWPALAAAAPRLAVAPVRSAPRGLLDAQLAAALCGDGRCVAGALTGPRPDLARARRLGADAALLGSVWRERGGLVLSLALFTEGRRPARTWVLPLADGRTLDAAQVARLRADVAAALGWTVAVPVTPRATSTPAQAPAPAPTAAAAPPQATAPAPPPAPALAPTPTAAAAPAPTSPPAPQAGPVQRGSPAPDAPWAALEAGIAPSRQALAFPGGATSPVGYEVTLPAQPLLRLELSPFAPGGGPLAGAGLFAEGAWLGGIPFPSGTRTHRATSWRLRAGLAWRLPLARWLAVTPDLAWEQETFVVGRADGIKVPGLPDSRLAGASAGLAAEVPLGDRASLLLSGRGTWWLQAGDLAGGATFYPGGRATGLAAEGGAAVRLAGPLSVRLLGTWSATRWRLDPDPSGAFAARSALAERWGGRAALRLER